LGICIERLGLSRQPEALLQRTSIHAPEASARWAAITIGFEDLTHLARHLDRYRKNLPGVLTLDLSATHHSTHGHRTTGAPFADAIPSELLVKVRRNLNDGASSLVSGAIDRL
jgi:hypothetical protein